MTSACDNFLDTCLFFNTNAFSRQLLRLAETHFKPLKISPAHASLLLMVFDAPGVNPKQLSRLLRLSPSTITRFIDVLARKKLVRRKVKGKSTLIFPTPRGLEIKPELAAAYKAMFTDYTRILGTTEAVRLSLEIAGATQKLMMAEDETNL